MSDNNNAAVLSMAADLGGVRVTPHGAGVLPLFIEPLAAPLARDEVYAVDWFERHRPLLDHLTTAAGAIVLRGFAIPTTSAFNRLVSSYAAPDTGYAAGATPRGQIEGRVFEATRAPPDIRIGLHQEMAYLPQHPARLAFWCATPSATGGETPIVDMRRFDTLVRPGFRAAVKAKGVLYERNFRAPESTGDAYTDAVYRPWTEAMGTDDPRAAEAACHAMGLECEWHGGTLTVIYRASGFIAHPATGAELWFNQIATLSPDRRRQPAARLNSRFIDRPLYRTCFGDGSEFDVDDIEGIIALLEELEVAFPWQRGDVMFIDNIHTAHGRHPFTGARDIQVALLN